MQSVQMDCIGVPLQLPVVSLVLARSVAAATIADWRTVDAALEAVSTRFTHHLLALYLLRNDIK